LGRGLDALLPSMSDEEPGGASELPVENIVSNPYQPRHDFDEDKLAELTQSIRQHGVIQPIVVRQHSGGQYELVAGERRLRAAKLAGLEVIPAIIGDFSDKQVMELAVVENLQREDLNPIEEALAYQTLLEEFGLTQEALAGRIGKSRPYVSNTVRLLNLPEAVQTMVAEGALSAGHARPLLSLDTVSSQLQIAEKIAAEGLSVRESEKLVQAQREQKTKAQKPKREAPRPAAGRDAEVLLLEDQLRQRLGTPVRISSSKSKGTIHIDFYSQDDLARIFELIVGLEEPL